MLQQKQTEKMDHRSLRALGMTPIQLVQVPSQRVATPNTGTRVVVVESAQTDSVWGVRGARPDTCVGF